MSVEERPNLFPFIHPLKDLVNLIPLKIHKGLSTVNIKFTCLDATPKYIVVGTSTGIAYLFNRMTGEMQKLECQGSTHPISCICCLETVDLMVALGTSAGLIVVFQIPLACSPLFGATNEVERYLITDIHLHPITCLQWSLNGMKLFSGNESGVVAQTDIDYTKHVIKSTILLKESDAIVQIDYCQRMLLVSTVRRTLLCITNEDFHVVQIGQKERKSLGNFGACFFTVAEIPQEVNIFVSRPSLRFWKSNTNGQVLETFIFKENSLCAYQMLVLGYNHLSKPTSKSESQFGILRAFTNNYLMTWHGEKLFVITQKEPAIVFRSDVFGGIVSVAVSEDEIFVLSGQRNIMRIAASSDHSRVIQTPVKEESLLQSLNFLNPLKELEYRFKESATKTSNLTASIFNKIKPTLSPLPKCSSALQDEHREQQVVSEDCGRVDSHTFNEDVSPPAISEAYCAAENQDTALLVNKKTKSPTCDGKSPEIVRQMPDMWSPLPISDESDNDGNTGIVFERKAKVKRAKSPLEPPEVQKVDVLDIDSKIDVDNYRILEELSIIDATEKALDANAPIASVGTREAKEILLAQMFNLKELLPDDLQRKSGDLGVEVFNPNYSDIIEQSHEDEAVLHNHEYPPTVEISPYDGERQHGIPEEPQYSSIEFDIYQTNHTNDNEEEEQGEIPNNAISECSSYLSYGPPSGSSNMASLNDVRTDSPNPSSLAIPPPLPVTVPKLHVLVNSLDNGLPGDGSSVSRWPIIEESSDKQMRYNDVWVQHKPPGHLCSLAVCEHYIVCTDINDTVYYSCFGGLGLEWHKTDYLANQISISPSGKRVWRVYRNSAYTLVRPLCHGPFGEEWVQVELNVIQVAVNENCVWYVTMNGDVFVQCFLNEEQTHARSTLVACSTKVTQVACTDGVVWAVTVDRSLLCRLGITKDNPEGTKWSVLSFTSGKVLAAALGASTGWIVDEAHNLWFQSGLMAKANPKMIDKKWWQVKISDYIYSNVSPLQNLMDSLHAEQLALILSKQNMPCLVYTKSQDIWFYHPHIHQLITNQNQIIGHHWNHVKLPHRISPQWRIMTSSGIYHHHGVIWLWRQGLDIGCFSPMTAMLSNVKLPECCHQSKPVCLSAAPETFWLLIESGRIFIRKDITVLNAIGSGWVELDLTQISNHKLVHISCGPNLVWACDSKGRILLRIGSLQAPTIHNFSPAWVVVEDSPSTSSMQVLANFVKVYVGPLDSAVWAIDNKNNVHVREGVFPELLIGLGWVLVSGIQAKQLAISECAVYALTPSGTIYRRYNISRNNYIGDYWMELPGQAEHISVTVDDKLWALSPKNELLQHQSYVLYSKTKELAPKTRSPTSPHSSIEGDWEMIDGCS